MTYIFPFSIIYMLFSITLWKLEPYCLKATNCRLKSKTLCIPKRRKRARAHPKLPPPPPPLWCNQAPPATATNSGFRHGSTFLRAYHLDLNELSLGGTLLKRLNLGTINLGTNSGSQVYICLCCGTSPSALSRL